MKPGQTIAAINKHGTVELFVMKPSGRLIMLCLTPGLLFIELVVVAGLFFLVCEGGASLWADYIAKGEN